MNRTSCHEAGHVVVAKSFGIKVNSVRVIGGMAVTVVDGLDATPREARQKYTYFAGGIAGENIVLGDYDFGGMGRDQREITQRGGMLIETYLPDAQDIILHHKRVFELIRRKLLEEFLKAGFDLDGSEILRESEIDQIWSNC